MSRMLEQYLREVSLNDDYPQTSEFPFALPVVAHLADSPLRFHPRVTFFVGENGSGKSTVLEAIAEAAGMNPEGGSRNFRFETRRTHSSLGQYVRLVRGLRRPKEDFFLCAESFYNVATQVEQLGVIGYGNRNLHEQSHGESFLALLTNRVRSNGLYLMDEPEAALSPSRQLSMLRIIHDAVSQNCQFVIATHSPIIQAYPDSIIYRFSPEGIDKVDFEETDHYIITRRFLNDRETMLNMILNEPASD